MMRVVRTSAAKADAREIWAYIAQDNPEAADRLLDRFDKLFRVLASQPLVGKSVEELVPNLRFVPIGNYLIFYRPTQERILHGARDINAEFFRE
jgi:toxin ParE1/3/4